jgi:hypothetical protein
MRTQRTRKQVLPVAAVLTAAMTGAPHAADPIAIYDLVGEWKNDDAASKNSRAKLRVEQGKLKLETNGSAAWDEVLAYNPATSRFTFEHQVTKDEILKNSKPDKPNDSPPPDEVAEAAANTPLKQTFRGEAKRPWLPRSDRCKLTMVTHEVGWHFKFDREKKTLTLDPAGTKPPERDSTFALLTYALPEVKEGVFETSLPNAEGLSETDRTSAGTEISTYFSEQGANNLLGNFAVALFTPLFAGVTEAVPAETFFGKVITKLAETLMIKGLQGDLKAKDFVKVVFKAYLDRALEGVSKTPPFDGIIAKFEKWTAGEAAKAADKAAGAATDVALTPLELEKLTAYFKNECRYELVLLKTTKAVGGAAAIVDRRLGTADIYLYLTAAGSRPALIVLGPVDIPEKDQRPKGILKIVFQVAGRG